jgi:hypothetical protein
MLENMPAETASVPRRMRRPGKWVRLPTEAHARRVEVLRRAYTRAIGHKATTIERAAVLKAALLTAKAEAAALDPTVPVAELTKLVNIADRAVRQLGLDGLHRRARVEGPSPLSKYLAAKYPKSSGEAAE